MRNGTTGAEGANTSQCTIEDVEEESRYRDVMPIKWYNDICERLNLSGKS